MDICVEKVTCFVENSRNQIAVFQHPYAGVQFPAGTVEPDENPRRAAIRETLEETGLVVTEDIHLV